MADLTDAQNVVLCALRRGCKEAPMTSREVGESHHCRALVAGRDPGAWASTHLRALAKKGLVFIDAPGAAKGYWRPTPEK